MSDIQTSHKILFLAGFILNRRHPDILDWSIERQEEAVTDLWEEALDIGLTSIMDELEKTDDSFPEDATLKRRE